MHVAQFLEMSPERCAENNLPPTRDPVHHHFDKGLGHLNTWNIGDHRKRANME